MGDRVWRLDRTVPRLDFCGDVSQYRADYIEAEVNQMRATLTGTFGAATAWGHASDKLGALAERVWQVANDLAGGWNSEDSVQCQQALQRIERTARELSVRSAQMSSFTNQAAEVMEHAVNTFSTDGGPGTAETIGTVGGGVLAGDLGSNVLGTIGGGLDSALGAFGVGGGPSKDEVAREHLAAWNQAYTEINPMLPEQVSVELPVVELKSQDLLNLPASYGTGGYAGAGGSAGGTPGAGMPGFDGSGVPTAPTGGFSAGDAGVAHQGDWDGTTGGLAGAGGYLPPPGGAGAGAPGTVGATGGGYGPAGAVAPAVGAAGRGAVGGGAVGRGAVGGGAAGRGAPGGGALGRGAGVPGGGRPGVGMVGAPVAGGAGGGSGRGGAAGRVAAGGGVAGRAGAAGGMVPMAGAGARGGGSDDSTHDSWLVEDEDPWRGDGDAPPSVIG